MHLGPGRLESCEGKQHNSKAHGLETYQQRQTAPPAASPKRSKPGGSITEVGLYSLHTTVSAHDTQGQPGSAARSKQPESTEKGTDLLSSPPKSITAIDTACKHLLKKSTIIKSSSRLC